MMTDAEVRDQVQRAEVFREALRDAIASTAIMSDAQRRGLQRIASTLDAVDFIVLCNLANLDAALDGILMELIEVKLLAVGGGPTLDYLDATMFLKTFQPMVDAALARMRH